MNQFTLLQGSVCIDKIYTREQAGRSLDPPVGSKQVARYLEELMLFHPHFEEFKTADFTLSRNTKLTNWHLPTLQQFRQLVQIYGLENARIRMAKK